MDLEEKLKLDYEQTTKYFHTLADIRFRLLALVPIATVAAIGLLAEYVSAGSLLAMGLLGFLAVFGIMIYDLRNTQIHDAMQKRAKTLEAILGFIPLDDETKKLRGGAFLDRPGRDLRLFGILRIWHDRGLAFIYGSSLAGWAYLITEGLVQAIGLESNIYVVTVEALIPVTVFILLFIELHRHDVPTDVREALSKRVRWIIYNTEESNKNLEDDR